MLCCVLAGTSCVSLQSDKTRGILIDLQKLEGFSVKNKPQVYEGEDLYEYINGAAESYHEYGFARVVTEELLIKHNDETVIIDIYDMGHTANAFGFFSRFRSSEAEYFDIGAGCQYSEPTLDMYKGNFLIQLAGSRPFPGLKEQLVRVAREIDGRMKVVSAKLDMLDLLPTGGRVPHTETYLKKNVLGFGFLNEAWFADYEINGQSQNLMLIYPGTTQEAARIIRKFHAEIPDLQALKMPGSDESLTGYNKYAGTVLICRKGKHIIYCSSPEKQADLKPLVSIQLKKLTAN